MNWQTVAKYAQASRIMGKNACFSKVLINGCVSLFQLLTTVCHLPRTLYKTLYRRNRFVIAGGVERSRLDGIGSWYTTTSVVSVVSYYNNEL